MKIKNNIKKISLSIAATLSILSLPSYANNAVWLTNDIFIYERPFIDSPRKALDKYKLGDEYNIISCNKYGWCISNDGYVKRLVLDINEDVKIVDDLEKVDIKQEDKNKDIDTLTSEDTFEDINQTVAINDNKDMNQSIDVKVENNDINLSIEEVKNKDINTSISKGTFEDTNQSLDVKVDNNSTALENKEKIENEDINVSISKSVFEDMNQTLSIKTDNNDTNLINKEEIENEDINTSISKVILKDTNETVSSNLNSFENKLKMDKNTIELSINSLIKEVIKRNPTMIYDRMQGEIIEHQISYENNILTPQFYINMTHQDSDTPNNTETTLSRGYLTTYAEKTNNIQVGMSGVLESGGKWNTSIKSNDRKSSLINKYKDYDTEYDNLMEISFTQPLLKGFGSDVTMSKYYLAKSDKQIHLKQYEKKLMDMMGSVIQTYWKYYGAKEIQSSYKKSVEINKQAIKILEEKAKSGDIPYSEVLEAKSASFIKEAELKKMDSELVKIKNDILSLLNVSIDSNKDIEFILKDKPLELKDEKYLSIKEYYRKAQDSWPEYMISKAKLKKEDLNLKFTQNQIKPQLDIITTASSTTLDDERNYRYMDDDFVTWSVGLQFSMPIFDEQSKSTLNMAKIKRKQVELEMESLDKGLYNVISSKLEKLKNSKEEMTFYKEGLKIKKELLLYTQKGFELGDKSIRDVLLQEEDIINYKRKLFNSIIDWKLAQASLDKVAGMLFKKYITYEVINNIKNKEYSQKLSNESFGKVN